jgi:hypothetical protein
MGYGTEERGGNKTYFSIRTIKDEKGRKQAVFAQQCSADAPGAKQVFDKDGNPSVDGNGKQRWRLEHNYLSGHLTKIDTVTHQIKNKDRKFLELHVRDVDSLVILSLERGDRFWVDFLMRAPGYEPELATIFRPYSIERENSDKSDSFLTMDQEGKKLERKWTKANNWGNDENGAGGLPQGVKDEDDGTWSFKARDKWLENNVLIPLMEKINATGTPAAAPATASPTSAPVASTNAGDEEDDLPF